MNVMNVLIGPKDMRVEVTGEHRYPLSIRPAYRTYDLSEPFDDLREHLASLVPEHPMDVRIVRSLRRAYRVFDEILWGPKWDRETDWALGVLIVTALVIVGLAWIPR